MCRWLSEESLHIYARMNETTYTYWLSRAMAARVDSVRTTSLAARLQDLDIIRLEAGIERREPAQWDELRVWDPRRRVSRHTEGPAGASTNPHPRC